MRDLAGWCLSVLLWTYPLTLLGTFVGWVEGDLYGFAFFLTLLAGFAWPGLFLVSRRLRQPSDLDVAEADGRPPVLVVCSLERARAPLWQRLFPTPAFFRDVGDELLAGALRRSLGPAGPVVFVARPAPPPSHGPMALVGGARDEHLAALLARAPSAQLVAVVLDGSETMRHELGHLAMAVDVRRIVLVVPPSADRELFEQWARFREQLPGLPPLEPRTAAVRFGEGGVPTIVGAVAPDAGARRSALGQPHLILREAEMSPVPGPPVWSWILTGVPLGMAVVSTVLTPIFAEEHGVSGSSSDWFGAAVLSLLLGSLLAIASRRVMRLVPGSELPLVLLAAAPWLAAEAIGAIGALPDLWRHAATLERAAIGAAISAPHLFGVSIVLAGSSLLRASPGRRASFGLFGAAITIPFLALTASLGDATVDVGGLILATLGTGAALALATIAATGDAGRRHAPLSIGSAASATLALAAWASVVGHGAWRQALRAADYANEVRLDEALAPLLEFDALWLAFLLPLPCVALVGLLFAGRSSKTAVASGATLLPLALLFGLVAGDHARAEAILAERGVLGGESFLAGAGTGLVPGFALASIHYGEVVRGSADVVLDRGGALAAGERRSSEMELASFGSMGTPALARVVGERLRAREARDTVVIAVAPDANGAALLSACRVAWAQGATFAQLAGQSPGGGTTGVLVRQHFVAYDARDGAPIQLYLVVRPGEVTLESSAGERMILPRDPDGRLGVGTAQAVLMERRRVEPNRNDLTVLVEGGPSAQDVLTALSAAYYTGYAELSLDDHRL